MLSHLRGTVHKMDIGEVSVDVQGVGYRVMTPVDVWDTLQEGSPAMLWISAYVREDRFDLFGFSDRAGRTLFEEFLKLPGIGPRMGLELCAVPRSLILQAVHTENVSLLTSIKGIGRKTAEKLLVELRSLVERKPDILGTESGGPVPHVLDQDAISALSSLGYDTVTIMRALKDLPPELESTEDRVTAALRSL